MLFILYIKNHAVLSINRTWFHYMNTLVAIVLFIGTTSYAHQSDLLSTQCTKAFLRFKPPYGLPIFILL